MSRVSDEVGIVLAPTMRSRAYMQMLEARGLRLSRAFLIPGADRPWDGAATVEVPLPDRATPFFLKPAERARDTAERLRLPAETLPSADINHAANVAALVGSGLKVLIYSGLPKILLRQPILGAGMRFLHVHGGYVPYYRGATAFYFGLLETGRLGQSAIWLNEGIDTGPVIMRRWYDAAADLSIDQVLDPVTRADLLATVLSHFESTGEFPAENDPADGEGHFVIHPVLKHLAIRRFRRSVPQP